MGTPDILLLMAVILVLSAPLLGGAFFKKRVLMILFPVLFVFLWAIHGQAFKKQIDENTYLFEETDYFTVQLKKLEKEGGTLDAVVLDNLIHSYVDLKDPLHLQYGYERITAELVAWHAASKPEFRALIIGGGGQQCPHSLEAKYPKAPIDG